LNVFLNVSLFSSLHICKIL